MNTGVHLLPDGGRNLEWHTPECVASGCQGSRYCSWCGERLEGPGYILSSNDGERLALVYEACRTEVLG